MRSLQNLARAAAIVAPLAVAGAAQAYTVSSAAVFGGLVQSTVTCYLANNSTLALTISAEEILTQSGTKLVLAGNTCGASLAAGATCSYYAASQKAVLCQATGSASSTQAAAIRGTIDLRDSSGTVILHEPIR